MIRSGILNAELNHAIASMGHGDLMIVCDAGFPIPSAAWRIDLAVVPDVPDLETVLLADFANPHCRAHRICGRAARVQRPAPQQGQAAVS